VGVGDGVAALVVVGVFEGFSVGVAVGISVEVAAGVRVAVCGSVWVGVAVSSGVGEEAHNSVGVCEGSVISVAVEVGDGVSVAVFAGLGVGLVEGVPAPPDVSMTTLSKHRPVKWTSFNPSVKIRSVSRVTGLSNEIPDWIRVSLTSTS